VNRVWRSTKVAMAERQFDPDRHRFERRRHRQPGSGGVLGVREVVANTPWARHRRKELDVVEGVHDAHTRVVDQSVTLFLMSACNLHGALRVLQARLPALEERHHLGPNLGGAGLCARPGTLTLIGLQHRARFEHPVTVEHTEPRCTSCCPERHQAHSALQSGLQYMVGLQYTMAVR